MCLKYLRIVQDKKQNRVKSQKC